MAAAALAAPLLLSLAPLDAVAWASDDSDSDDGWAAGGAGPPLALDASTAKKSSDKKHHPGRVTLTEQLGVDMGATTMGLVVRVDLTEGVIYFVPRLTLWDVQKMAYAADVRVALAAYAAGNRWPRAPGISRALSRRLRMSRPTKRAKKTADAAAAGAEAALPKAEQLRVGGVESEAAEGVDADATVDSADDESEAAAAKASPTRKRKYSRVSSSEMLGAYAGFQEGIMKLAIRIPMTRVVRSPFVLQTFATAVDSRDMLDEHLARAPLAEAPAPTMRLLSVNVPKSYANIFGRTLLWMLSLWCDTSPEAVLENFQVRGRTRTRLTERLHDAGKFAAMWAGAVAKNPRQLRPIDLHEGMDRSWAFLAPLLPRAVLAALPVSAYTVVRSYIELHTQDAAVSCAVPLAYHDDSRLATAGRLSPWALRLLALHGYSTDSSAGVATVTLARLGAATARIEDEASALGHAMFPFSAVVYMFGESLAAQLLSQQFIVKVEGGEGEATGQQLCITTRQMRMTSSFAVAWVTGGVQSMPRPVHIKLGNVWLSLYAHLVEGHGPGPMTLVVVGTAVDVAFARALGVHAGHAADTLVIVRMSPRHCSTHLGLRGALSKLGQRGVFVRATHIVIVHAERLASLGLLMPQLVAVVQPITCLLSTQQVRPTVPTLGRVHDMATALGGMRVGVDLAFSVAQLRLTTPADVVAAVPDITERMTAVTASRSDFTAYMTEMALCGCLSGSGSPAHTVNADGSFRRGAVLPGMVPLACVEAARRTMVLTTFTPADPMRSADLRTLAVLLPIEAPAETGVLYIARAQAAVDELGALCYGPRAQLDRPRARTRALQFKDTTPGASARTMWVSDITPDEETGALVVTARLHNGAAHGCMYTEAESAGIMTLRAAADAATAHALVASVRRLVVYAPDILDWSEYDYATVMRLVMAVQDAAPATPMPYVVWAVPADARGAPVAPPALAMVTSATPMRVLREVLLGPGASAVPGGAEE